MLYVLGYIRARPCKWLCECECECVCERVWFNSKLFWVWDKIDVALSQCTFFSFFYIFRFSSLVPHPCTVPLFILFYCSHSQVSGLQCATQNIRRRSGSENITERWEMNSRYEHRTTISFQSSIFGQKEWVKWPLQMVRCMWFIGQTMARKYNKRFESNNKSVMYFNTYKTGSMKILRSFFTYPHICETSK